MAEREAARAREAQNLEWKRSWRDEYLKWVCGFANAQGGILEIGRNDRGEVVGLEDAARLLRDLPEKIRALLGIVVDVDLAEEDGKESLRISVEPHPTPIAYKGEYHYRSGSTKQVLRGPPLDRFLLRKLGRPWDSAPVPGVGVEDLDSRAIDRFRRSAIQRERLPEDAHRETVADLIAKLRLAEGRYLKRAALLLFHEDPERFATGAFVKIGYFRGADLRFQDEVHGDLFLQAERIIDLLLTKYSEAVFSYGGIQRVETRPIPSSAVREVVLNAVIHKDYAANNPVQIRVYGDRMVFWNPGALPEGWTVERLLEPHASVPRNPEVANAFFRAGQIEAWGRGVSRILNECRRAEMPMPVWESDASGTRVEIVFSTHRTGRVRDSGVGKEARDAEEIAVVDGEEKTTQAPEGTTQTPEGTTQTPEGTTQTATQTPEGTTQRTTQTPEGTTQTTTQTPEGTTQRTTQTPEGTTQTTTQTPEGTTQRTTQTPEGTTQRTTQTPEGTTQTTTQTPEETTQRTTQTLEGTTRTPPRSPAGKAARNGDSDTAARILDLLRRRPDAGRRELAATLGDITEDGVKYHLDRLKERGRLRRVGPDFGGRWEVLDGDGER